MTPAIALASRRLSPTERLGEDIAELAARIHAATYELLVMLREFDADAGWNNGFLSCAHWLNWRTSIDLGAAREKVRVARALAGLPRISAAMQCGSVSYAKVRAITRVATPETEQRLLDVALTGRLRTWSASSAPGAAWTAWWRRRTLTVGTCLGHLTTWVDDGMLVLRGRLSPEVGAVVCRALEAVADQLYREAKAAPNAGGLVDEVDAGQRRADALGRLAEVALATDLDAGTAGDRYQVVLHVDAGAGQPVDGDQFDGALEVTDGALRVSAEMSRRLACDSAVVRMQHDHDGNVLDVGRKTRTIPPAIRRALQARDNRCQFPGCTARRCDAHHIEHWVDGGATNLDNLLLLCRRHHRTVHEGTIKLARQEDGTTAFFHQNGLPVPLAPPLPQWAHRHPLAPTTDRLSAAGIAINARTLPTWDGTPFNVVHAIDVLYVRRELVVDCPP